MSDPSLEVQEKIFAILDGQSPPLAGGRIYDAKPPDPAFPYIVIGDGDSVGADNDCFRSSLVTARVHVWSRAVGWPEAEALARQLRDLLTVELTLADYHNVLGEFRGARWLPDPDGITRHAVVEFRYHIDHRYSALPEHSDPPPLPV